MCTLVFASFFFRFAALPPRFLFILLSVTFDEVLCNLLMLVLLFVFQQKNSLSTKSLGRETKYVSKGHVCPLDRNNKLALASFRPGSIHLMMS